MGLAHGTICWADVAVPDMAAGEAFYEGLFGWEAQPRESESFPYTMSWNEIASRDVDAAVAFYTELLGWNAEAMDFDGFPCTVLEVGDRSNGGAYDMPGFLPDEIPAHWLVWFIVEDCARAAGDVVELGGTVQRVPEESGIGISAVVSDPFGATFGIIETSPG